MPSLMFLPMHGVLGSASMATLTALEFSTAVLCLAIMHLGALDN